MVDIYSTQNSTIIVVNSLEGHHCNVHKLSIVSDITHMLSSFSILSCMWMIMQYKRLIDLLIDQLGDSFLFTDALVFRTSSKKERHFS